MTNTTDKTIRKPKGRNSGGVNLVIAAVSLAATLAGWAVIAATSPADAAAASASTSGVALQAPSTSQSAPTLRSVTLPSVQTNRPLAVTRSRSSR